MSVRWWHCLLGHHWSKWADEVLRIRNIAYGVPMEEWRDTPGQSRDCAVCGKRELRAP